MEKIIKLRKLFKTLNLDGYIIPKNNNFFGEYISESEDNLKYISNFTGSAGFAVILKNKNYMFVDGRYTIQAGIQCGKQFQICNIPKKYPFNVFKKKKLCLGFDPKLHTENSLNKFFEKTFIKFKPINKNLIDQLWKKKEATHMKPFYLIKDKDAGLNVNQKLAKLVKLIKFNKVNYLFTTASENIAWAIFTSYLIIVPTLSSENKKFFKLFLLLILITEIGNLFSLHNVIAVKSITCSSASITFLYDKLSYLIA